MLSQDAIDNLIQPIIDRQETINRYIIRQLAQRIREIGELLPSDMDKLYRLMQTGADVRLVNQVLANLTSYTEIAIKDIIRDVAIAHYQDVKPFYDYRHKSYIPFDENKQLQNVVKAIESRTLGDYKNISNTRSTGFLIRDYQNPTKLKWHSIGETYQTVTDEAIQSIQSGTIDYNTAMRRTVDQLVQSGVRRISYSPESGRQYTKRLDSAVRMNVMDGVRAVNQGVQDEIGKQIGTDGKEISVHACPAPDHALLQGRQFTNEQYDLVQSQQEGATATDYNGMAHIVPKRSIGMWNCQHFTRSVILGISKPLYTPEQLDKINEDNERGVMIGGKHYTLYEATQKQRELETTIRYAKDGQIAAREVGDTVLIQKYQDKVKHYTETYMQFSKEAGLKPKLDRIRVDGYQKLKI